MKDQEVVDSFHRLYYGAPERTIYNTHWLGVAAQKYPTDMWVYQEILHELRPDFVIETGTYWGGSALFLASICELLQHGQVISIDIRQIAESDRTNPRHPRITYLEGSSISVDIVACVREIVGGANRVMVILDSDHGREHVFNELKIWADFVTDGSYLIIEDTNVNGHPVLPEFGPGPMEAVDLFLAQNDAFVLDRTREKFLLTANPRGYLKKVTSGSAEARLLEAEDTITGLRAQIHNLEQDPEELTVLKAELEVSRLQTRSAVDNLERVTGSASWRLTAPLRALGRALRGAK